MENIWENSEAAVAFIRQKTNLKPVLGCVLGSGLGQFADGLEEAVRIPFEDVPGCKPSTVAGHSGAFIIGTYRDVPMVIMQGRYHYYEGYSMPEVTFPIRVMHQLGCRELIVTNACGGMDESFSPGQFMLITDHLNLTGDHPLIGKNDERFGPRFPDLSSAYDQEWQQVARTAAGSVDVTLQQGVYAAISGPSYLSHAELRMLRTLGADAVGMSTVPEVIVARHMGMRVLGISCITDLALGTATESLTHEEVVAVADAASAQFVQLLTTIVELAKKERFV
ncbi:purine-nucleoside phosphorylase [Aureibacillus halotolerans]|uniref:Purine nucleoside phosphorylase n=1 Tax=Aureibacillus halotolerans TaxID=1508390 RepID=A0A4R6UA95_9BACI|nr:purine-nucleoside phosphorylase [Aureibacillus halotolerans]TDQ41605.1 purine-nucleoside phosphorylase [Aureibacillus halotolerans]